MLRIFARRMGEVTPPVGQDEVILGLSLPSDSVIHDIRMKFSVVPASNNQEIGPSGAAMYAIEAWIVPVFDPDSPSTYDVLWDTLVPKDTDVQTLDLDTGSADTSVFYEPGEMMWEALFDVGVRPERIYHRHKLVTYENTLGMRFVDSQTPFEPKWTVGDRFQFHDRKRYRVRQPSVLLVACGIPSLDDTTGTVASSLAENSWARVKYLGDVLKQALMDVLGLVESTAETPWEEATDLVQEHVDPDVYESDAGSYSPETMKFFAEMTVDHSVVGTLGVVQVTTGR